MCETSLWVYPIIYFSVIYMPSYTMHAALSALTLWSSTSICQTGCSGVRDRTAYVSTRDIGSRELRSDFHFLEDVLQTKDSAKRTFKHNCGGHAGLQGAGGINKRRKFGNNGRVSSAEVITDIPIMLSETYQRMDSYKPAVRRLFTAVSEIEDCAGS